MKRLFILPALILFAIHSCTFKQDVTFNKNWSGEMRGLINMKEMAALFGEGGEEMNLLQEEDTQKKMKALKATPGIKKVKMTEMQKGVYEFSFQFKNIKALNASANVLFSDEKNTQQNFTYFDLKDQQTLYFSMPFGDQYINQEEEVTADNSMAESFAYELTLRFPKKINRIETQNGAVLSDDKTSINLKSDILTMTSSGFHPGMLVVFEK